MTIMDWVTPVGFYCVWGYFAYLVEFKLGPSIPDFALKMHKLSEKLKDK